MSTDNFIFSDSYIITNFSNSISKGERAVTVSTPSSDGVKIITFNGVFSSSEADEVLRISDGVTTIDFTCDETGGSSSGAANKIGTGGDRSPADVTAELASKINSSALDITAVDQGGSASTAAIELTPGSGKTITITEDPGSSPRDGVFGSTANFVVISNNSSPKTTNSPFRFMSITAGNLRLQSSQGAYRTFIGID